MADTADVMPLPAARRQLHLMLIVDVSGSMQRVIGKVWNTMEEFLAKCQNWRGRQSTDPTHPGTTVVTCVLFNDRARVAFHRIPLDTVLNDDLLPRAVVPGCTTDYSAAMFMALAQVSPNDETVTIFLTDGEDTTHNKDALFAQAVSEYKHDAGLTTQKFFGIRFHSDATDKFLKLKYLCAQLGAGEFAQPLEAPSISKLQSVLGEISNAFLEASNDTAAPYVWERNDDTTIWKSVQLGCIRCPSSLQKEYTDNGVPAYVEHIRSLMDDSELVDRGNEHGADAPWSVWQTKIDTFVRELQKPDGQYPYAIDVTATPTPLLQFLGDRLSSIRRAAPLRVRNDVYGVGIQWFDWAPKPVFNAKSMQVLQRIDTVIKNPSHPEAKGVLIAFATNPAFATTEETRAKFQAVVDEYATTRGLGNACRLRVVVDILPASDEPLILAAAHRDLQVARDAVAVTYKPALWAQTTSAAGPLAMALGAAFSTNFCFNTVYVNGGKFCYVPPMSYSGGNNDGDDSKSNAANASECMSCKGDDSTRTYAYAVCGHTAYCDTCYERVQRTRYATECVVCRVGSNRLQRLYNA